MLKRLALRIEEYSLVLLVTVLFGVVATVFNWLRLLGDRSYDDHAAIAVLQAALAACGE